MTLTLDAAGRRVRLDPRDPAFFDDPYRAYAAIRAAAPTFFWEDYGFWCFAAHADVSALLRDKRFGRQILHVMSRDELGWPAPKPHLAPFDALERQSLLEMEPPEHTRLRNLVNRAFVSRQVEKLAPRIAALAHQRIDAFARDGEADLIEAFATPIPVAVIMDLLGAPREIGPQLLDWSHRMMAMYQFGVTRAVEDIAANAAREFADFMRGYARARRADLRDDLISQLLAAESEEGKLSEDELVTTCILLLNAGHEATVHAIGNAAKTILERRLDPQDIFADAKTTEAAVEELLRLDAPLHLFTRYALDDVEFSGLRLRKGQKIGLLLGAANRDVARFADPDAFQPGRDPNPHVAFGAGIHFCIGARLARLEMAVALPILFQRLPGLRFANRPRYRDAFHFHGLEALAARWDQGAPTRR
ncbi:cytochrome P450 [Roseiarcus sp.]|uniref:cytochrome P450 n=1 Tax=Roseiarcus sp. TaxID=1969460 RepID=UPI003F9A7648